MEGDRPHSRRPWELGAELRSDWRSRKRDTEPVRIARETGQSRTYHRLPAADRDHRADAIALSACKSVGSGTSGDEMKSATLLSAISVVFLLFMAIQHSAV